MGLGKTVQALVWLLHLYDADPDGGPTLVVCPASVVHNWAREAERFTPRLRVLLLTSGKTRHSLRDEIPNHDLVVTTYALLRRDLDAWRDVALRAVILDEAQFIKNPDAAVSRAARELTTRHRLALTGTPLENRALDLWSILAFVNPGYLGNRNDFSARYDRADAPPHLRALLAAKLRPVLLRRTKQAVAPELPPRIEERRDCELTDEQRQLYVSELQRTRTLLTRVGEAPGGVARNKITILAALTRLRQICCHPALAGGRATLGSGKFDALFELLEPILAEGHKVLVFSQFVRCIKLLAAELHARGIRYHQLTGQTTKRAQVVEAFQDDPEPCVFLISLKAGGTGLNLTAASYVVLFDPWWNPAVEAQAIDRTHRIGQDRTVIAYRLLTIGTIEEKIWQLQQRRSRAGPRCPRRERLPHPTATISSSCSPTSRSIDGSPAPRRWPRGAAMRKSARGLPRARLCRCTRSSDRVAPASAPRGAPQTTREFSTRSARASQETRAPRPHCGALRAPPAGTPVLPIVAEPPRGERR
jgi:SNF2 family DNA or RNA helicase